jgi:probable rRNA maturation factor
VRLEVAVIYATRKPWVPTRKQIARWVRAAVGGRRGAWSLGLRIVGRAEGRRVNRQFRRRDRPTNVLSFNATVRAADGRRLLGDLVVCAPVVAREAREQRKTRAAHWAHMIVHGTLHLRGYDHQRDADARRMERRERSVLAALGFADPYEVTHQARHG